jgi:O-antigen/teichoic acid export membrane protein
VPELEATGAGDGVARLLRTVLGVQTLLAALAGLVLVAARPLWERLFGPAIGPLLGLVALLAAVWVLKETLYQLHFALARARVLTLATAVTSVGWLALTWVLLARGHGPAGALVAQTVALGVAILLLAPSARAALAQLARADVTGIPVRRVLPYAATVTGSGLVNLVVQRQSEVFFLAAVAPPAVVGFYDLGYSLPQLGLELVPLSLYAVMMSAITATATREPGRLGALVGWYYKLLALVTVPVALLGAAWGDRLLVLLYGAEMAPAGDLARVFSLVHLLPFVSVPVGTALAVREQAHRTLPFGVVQLTVNLLLDVLLIPRFGVAGAVAAVVLTFLLVTPPTIRYALRFTGPLEFPVRWVVRLTVSLAPGLLPMAARPWLEGWWGVTAGVAASVLLMAIGLRLGGVLGPEDRERLVRSRLPGRGLLLLVLTGRRP